MSCTSHPVLGFVPDAIQSIRSGKLLKVKHVCCAIFTAMLAAAAKNEKLNLSKFPRSATARPPWLLVVPSARLIFDQEPRYTTLQNFSPAPFFKAAQIKKLKLLRTHAQCVVFVFAGPCRGRLRMGRWAPGCPGLMRHQPRVAAEMTNDRVEELSAHRQILEGLLSLVLAFNVFCCECQF